MDPARRSVRKYQVDATLRDRNLCIPQGRMCRTEIYSAYRKSLPVATETGVGDRLQRSKSVV